MGWLAGALEIKTDIHAKNVLLLCIVLKYTTSVSQER